MTATMILLQASVQAEKAGDLEVAAQMERIAKWICMGRPVNGRGLSVNPIR